MNGVISNGFEPRIFSICGIAISPICTWQDGHHEITCPLLPCDSLSIVASATRP